MVKNIKPPEPVPFGPYVKGSLSFGVSFISSFFIAFILGYYLGMYIFQFEYTGCLITALITTIFTFYVEIILFIIKQDKADKFKQS